MHEVGIACTTSTQAEVKVRVGHAGQRAANVVLDREDVLPVSADREQNSRRYEAANNDVTYQVK